MNWRWPHPREAFFILLVVIGGWLVYQTWKEALTPPPILHSGDGDGYDHAWRIKGVVRKAHHISTSAPDYMGSSGFSVAGYDANGVLLWSVSGCHELEAVR